MSDIKSVVVDVGSCFIKAGLAGDEVVRRLPNAKVYGVTSSASFDFAMGEQAVAQAHTQGTPETVQRTKFMQGGEIVDVDGLEEVLEYLYAEELRLPAEEQPLLLVASDLQSKETRELLCQMVFEKIGVPAFYTGGHGIMSLFSVGKSSGIAVDIGDESTRIVIAEDGKVYPSSVMKIPVGGATVAAQFMDVIGKEQFPTFWHELRARELSSKLCTVPLWPRDRNMDTTPCEIQLLPDSAPIRVASNKLRECTSTLLSPQSAGIECNSIAHTIYDSFNTLDGVVKAERGPSDRERDREALSNIVLCGGGSVLPGLSDRVQRELEGIVPSSRSVRSTLAEDAENAAWMGAAMLADLKSFESLWCGRREYDEMGPLIVNKKCVTG